MARILKVDISRVPKEYKIKTREQLIQEQIDWRQYGIDNDIPGAKEKGPLSRKDAEILADRKICAVCGRPTPECEAVIKELERIRSGEIPDYRKPKSEIDLRVSP